MITEKVRLVFSDLGKNSYKYWDGELYDDGTVISRYGVVGATNPQEKNYGSVGKSFLDKKVREKLKKGYEHAKVIIDGPTAVAGAGADIPKNSLADIALSQIRFSNDLVKKLIRRLADSNVHKITSATNITFNAASGLFQTPLGVVTQDAIDSARNLLAFFNSKTLIDREYEQNINAYLRLIPRAKGNKLRYEQIFPDKDSVQKESDLLDALANSLSIVSTPAPVANGVKAAPVEQVFKLKLDILDDARERDRIVAWYEKSKKSMHHYDNVKVREVYIIDIEDYNARFDAKVGNNVEVWHGSSQANILSIGKVGLKVSPPSTAAIAGKMFGNGVYGSQTSSKSLGYTLGRWGQGGGDSGWLFVCDFAMGKAYYPTRATSSLPQGHDSMWALPAKTGLQNDELIVFNESQIRVKYLLEVK